MLNTEIYYKGIGWVECKLFDVEDLEGNVIGEVYIPIDRGLLDIMDCLVTLWASDNGMAVDDIYVDY